MLEGRHSTAPERAASMMAMMERVAEAWAAERGRHGVTHAGVRCSLPRALQADQCMLRCGAGCSETVWPCPRQQGMLRSLPASIGPAVREPCKPSSCLDCRSK